MRSSSQRLYYLLGDGLYVREGMMRISPYCFLLWCHKLDTAPADQNISSQAHQKKLQLPKRPTAQPKVGQWLGRAGVFPALTISEYR